MKFVLDRNDSMMKNRYNHLSHFGKRSRIYLLVVLTWILTMVYLIASASISEMNFVWWVQALVAIVFINCLIFKRSQEQYPKKLVTSKLSRGSACIWQLEKEA